MGIAVDNILKRIVLLLTSALGRRRSDLAMPILADAAPEGELLGFIPAHAGRPRWCRR